MLVNRLREKRGRKKLLRWKGRKRKHLKKRLLISTHQRRAPTSLVKEELVDKATNIVMNYTETEAKVVTENITLQFTFTIPS